MSKLATIVTLEDRAEALRISYGDNVKVEDISNVVGSLVKGSQHDDALHGVASELHELLEYINAAKNELIVMQPKNMSGYHIPDTHSQLDAIVQSTEIAATTILDAAEACTELAFETDEKVAERLTDISTQLFEASSFQDLTGQRITKITSTLDHMEERLNALADAIGDTYVESDEGKIETDSEGVAVHDEDLLHGPQLEGEGNSQDDIDALLASFD
jgi:chemotaxis protein CheZ